MDLKIICDALNGKATDKMILAKALLSVLTMCVSKLALKGDCSVSKLMSAHAIYPMPPETIQAKFNQPDDYLGLYYATLHMLSKII